MLGDPEQGEPPEVFVQRGAHYAHLPFKQMAKAIPGSWPNMIALGMGAGLCGLPLESVHAVLQKSLKKGGGEKMAANLAAADAGYAAAAKVQTVPRLAAGAASGAEGKSRWLITGNQAAGFGALRGGVVPAPPIRSRRQPKCWNGWRRRCPRWAAHWCRPRTNWLRST